MTEHQTRQGLKDSKKRVRKQNKIIKNLVKMIEDNCTVKVYRQAIKEKQG